MGAKSTKRKKEGVREYLLTDVAACTFTFTDGLRSRVRTSSENQIVLVKLIPHTSKSKVLEDRVLRHYSSVNSIGELATLCGYDCLRTFTRHFKKSFSQTPYQWLLERKMEEIRSMVVSSDLSITEIARMYEFKNASHLVNAFTKRYGISPQKCRLSNAI
ncbi:MAG: helix-turn-helix domain-containing protein [bacterium]|nr:helix-turn-helix domain-containing protein [bacterium]MDD4458783.1 helix-turn-helix domain-containing protein [Proteiniphilum sp.]